MQSVNLRQLRDTRQIKAWLKAGQVIEVRARNAVLGRLVPEAKPESTVAWPDFAARRKAIFDRVVNVVDDLIADREYSRY